MGAVLWFLGSFLIVSLLPSIASCRTAESSNLAEVVSSKPYVGLGEEHLCALKDGKVSCWHDHLKKLAVVPELPPVLKLAVGPKQNCVISEAGIHCWGATAADKNLPVPSIDAPEDITVGEDYACALAQGDVTCWWVNPKDELVVKKVPNLNQPSKLFLAYINTHRIPDQTQIPRGGNLPCIVQGTDVSCLSMWKDQTGERSSEAVKPVHAYIADAPQMECGRSGPSHENGYENGCIYKNYKYIVDSRGDLSQVVNSGAFFCELFDRKVHCWSSRLLEVPLGSPVANVKLKVPSLKAPTSIAVNASYACAVDEDRVVCWNVIEEVASPFSGRPLELVSNDKNMCAVYSGRLDCVGFYSHGQALYWRSNKLKDMSVAERHMCAMDDHEIRCWGDNTLASSGMLYPPSVNQPAELASSMDKTCVLHESKISCWGRGGDAHPTPPEWGVPTHFAKGSDICPVFSNVGIRCLSWLGGTWRSPQDTYDGIYVPENTSLDGYAKADSFACILLDGKVDCRRLGDDRFESARPYVLDGISKAKQITTDGGSRLHVLDQNGLKTFSLYLAGNDNEPRAELVSTREIPEDSSISKEGGHICYSSRFKNQAECWDSSAMANDFGELDVPALTAPRKIEVSPDWGRPSTCAIDDEGFKCWGEVFSQRKYKL